MNKFTVGLMLLLLSPVALADDAVNSTVGVKKKCYPVYIDNVRKSSCDKNLSTAMSGQQPRNAAMVSSKPRIWRGTTKSKKKSLFNTSVNARSNGGAARGNVKSSVSLGF